MTNQPREPTERDTTASDLTVLRGNTGSGSGESDAPRVLKQRFVLEAKLGAGGMGTVYLAEDLKHKRQVALKVLKPDLAAVLGAERFVQEITTTASL